MSEADALEQKFKQAVREESEKIINDNSRSIYVTPKELSEQKTIREAAPDHISDISGRVGVVLSNVDYATEWSEATYKISF